MEQKTCGSEEVSVRPCCMEYPGTPTKHEKASVRTAHTSSTNSSRSEPTKCPRDRRHARQKQELGRKGSGELSVVILRLRCMNEAGRAVPFANIYATIKAFNNWILLARRPGHCAFASESLRDLCDILNQKAYSLTSCRSSRDKTQLQSSQLRRQRKRLPTAGTLW